MEKNELLKQTEAASRAFREAFKEALRLGIIAVVSIFIKVMTDKFAPLTDTNVLAGIVFVFLRALDKWLWRYKKDLEGEGKGLIPF